MSVRVWGCEGMGGIKWSCSRLSPSMSETAKNKARGEGCVNYVVLSLALTSPFSTFYAPTQHTSCAHTHTHTHIYTTHTHTHTHTHSTILCPSSSAASTTWNTLRGTK